MDFETFFYVHFFSYWATCSVFTVLDFSLKKDILDKYKFNTNINKIQLVKTIGNSLTNQFIMFILVWISKQYYVYTANNSDIELLTLLLWLVLGDVYFYITHRLCHSWTPFYKTIHWLHHVYNDNPVCTTTLDSHIFENILVNFGSFIIGPIITFYWNDCVYDNLMVLWVIVFTTGGCMSHSGYRVLGENHHKHHINGKCNFGFGLYLCDKLLNTFE